RPQRAARGRQAQGGGPARSSSRRAARGDRRRLRSAAEIEQREPEGAVAHRPEADAHPANRRARARPRSIVGQEGGPSTMTETIATVVALLLAGGAAKPVKLEPVAVLPPATASAADEELGWLMQSKANAALAQTTLYA